MKYLVTTKKALCASVIINLLLIGILAGSFFNKQSWKGGKKNFDKKIEKIDFLDAEKKDLVKRELSKIQSRKGKSQEYKEHKKELIEIYSEENFDEDKFRAKINEMKNLRKSKFDGMNQAFINIARELSAIERKKFAESFFSRKHKKKRK